MRLAAPIARLTASGALAGALALPSGRMVATSAGGAPSGAPGSPVVVVVEAVWPAAGDAARSAPANRSPANPSLLHRRLERDSKRPLLRFLPIGLELGFSSAAP